MSLSLKSLFFSFLYSVVFVAVFVGFSPGVLADCDCPPGERVCQNGTMCCTGEGCPSRVCEAGVEGANCEWRGEACVKTSGWCPCWERDYAGVPYITRWGYDCCYCNDRVVVGTCGFCDGSGDGGGGDTPDPEIYPDDQPGPHECHDRYHSPGVIIRPDEPQWRIPDEEETNIQDVQITKEDLWELVNPGAADTHDYLFVNQGSITANKFPIKYAVWHWTPFPRDDDDPEGVDEWYNCFYQVYQRPVPEEWPPEEWIWPDGKPDCEEESCDLPEGKDKISKIFWYPMQPEIEWYWNDVSRKWDPYPTPEPWVLEGMHSARQFQSGYGWGCFLSQNWPYRVTITDPTSQQDIQVTTIAMGTLTETLEWACYHNSKLLTLHYTPPDTTCDYYNLNIHATLPDGTTPAVDASISTDLPASGNTNTSGDITFSNISVADTSVNFSVYKDGYYHNYANYTLDTVPATCNPADTDKYATISLQDLPDEAAWITVMDGDIFAQNIPVTPPETPDVKTSPIDYKFHSALINLIRTDENDFPLVNPGLSNQAYAFAHGPITTDSIVENNRGGSAENLLHTMDLRLDNIDNYLDSAFRNVNFTNDDVQNLDNLEPGHMYKMSIDNFNNFVADSPTYSLTEIGTAILYVQTDTDTDTITFAGITNDSTRFKADVPDGEYYKYNLVLVTDADIVIKPNVYLGDESVYPSIYKLDKRPQIEAGIITSGNLTIEGVSGSNDSPLVLCTPLIVGGDITINRSLGAFYNAQYPVMSTYNDRNTLLELTIYDRDIIKNENRYGTGLGIYGTQWIYED